MKLFRRRKEQAVQLLPPYLFGSTYVAEGAKNMFEVPHQQGCGGTIRPRIRELMKVWEGLPASKEMYALTNPGILPEAFKNSGSLKFLWRKEPLLSRSCALLRVLRKEAAIDLFNLLEGFFSVEFSVLDSNWREEILGVCAKSKRPLFQQTEKLLHQPSFFIYGIECNGMEYDSCWETIRYGMETPEALQQAVNSWGVFHHPIEKVLDGGVRAGSWG